MTDPDKKEAFKAIRFLAGQMADGPAFWDEVYDKSAEKGGFNG